MRYPSVPESGLASTATIRSWRCPERTAPRQAVVVVLPTPPLSAIIAILRLPWNGVAIFASSSRRCGSDRRGRTRPPVRRVTRLCQPDWAGAAGRWTGRAGVRSAAPGAGAGGRVSVGGRGCTVEAPTLPAAGGSVPAAPGVPGAPGPAPPGTTGAVGLVGPVGLVEAAGLEGAVGLVGTAGLAEVAGLTGVAGLEAVGGLVGVVGPLWLGAPVGGAVAGPPLAGVAGGEGGFNGEGGFGAEPGRAGPACCPGTAGRPAAGRAAGGTGGAACSPCLVDWAGAGGVPVREPPPSSAGAVAEGFAGAAAAVGLSRGAVGGCSPGVLLALMAGCCSLRSPAGLAVVLSLALCLSSVARFSATAGFAGSALVSGWTGCSACLPAGAAGAGAAGDACLGGG